MPLFADENIKKKIIPPGGPYMFYRLGAPFLNFQFVLLLLRGNFFRAGGGGRQGGGGGWGRRRLVGVGVWGVILTSSL